MNSRFQPAHTGLNPLDNIILEYGHQNDEGEDDYPDEIGIPYETVALFYELYDKQGMRK